MVEERKGGIGQPQDDVFANLLGVIGTLKSSISNITNEDMVARAQEKGQ